MLVHLSLFWVEHPLGTFLTSGYSSKHLVMSLGTLEAERNLVKMRCSWVLLPRAHQVCKFLAFFFLSFMFIYTDVFWKVFLSSKVETERTL